MTFQSAICDGDLSSLNTCYTFPAISAVRGELLGDVTYSATSEVLRTTPEATCVACFDDRSTVRCDGCGKAVLCHG